MAVEFVVKGTGGTRGSEYRYFPEQITLKADLNGRHELPNIEWLIADIVARSESGTTGQLEPVTIRKGPKGEPVLVAGFSRLRAVSEINKRKLLGDKIPLRCVYTQLTESQAFIANISENRFRNATTLLDDAHNIARLRAVYMKSDEDIAAIYHPGAKDEQLKDAITWVKKTAKLAALTPKMEKAVRAGRVKPSAVTSIAKLSDELQNTLSEGDGTIKAPAPVKAAKPVLDKELRKLVKAVLEDVSGILAENTTEEYIEVSVKLLAALNTYMTPAAIA